MRRYTALDGLRGLAALIVVFHHTLLTSPPLAAPYDQPGTPVGGVAGWFTYTPLHLLLDGRAAVLIFFVLSGFVLTLPQLSERRRSWRAYYVRRLLRLYLPVAGAVALSAFWIEAVPRHPQPGASWWMLSRPDVVRPGEVVRDLVLVRGQPGFLNGALWSLKWEVLFSLLLPVFVLGVTRWRRGWLAKLLLVGLLIAAGTKESRWLYYLPMFGIGALMAVERERLSVLSRRLTAGWWAVVATAGLMFLNAAWWSAAGNRAHGLTAAVVDELTVAGAATIVLLFLCCPAAKRIGDSGGVQWLGRRSFSLYLVHEPVVISIAMLLGPANPLLMLAVAVPASLVVAVLFYRYVEAPSHRFARASGAFVERRRPSWPVSVVPAQAVAGAAAPGAWPDAPRAASTPTEPEVSAAPAVSALPADPGV